MTHQHTPFAPAATRAIGAAFALGLSLALAPSAAAQVERMEIWDLQEKLGSGVADMPARIEFRSYACGSNGGPPRRPLAGWDEFALCSPEPGTGLYEVYFEYDNEGEYILRAMNDARVARYVGTTDKSFPVMTSALFDAEGVLRGIRLVTDPRPDYSADAFFDLTTLRTRDTFYLLGPYLGAQFVIDPDVNCLDVPLGPGETEVGSSHTKLDCEKVDEAGGLRYILQTRFFRKLGQLDRDPATGLLTVGQFESYTRAEIYQIGYGPTEPLVPPR